VTAVDVRPVVAPWDPRDPDFLLAWALEMELAAARDADAADWSRASYGRVDGRRDHPGGPVPVW
jgi:hypothetical protein